MNMNTRILTPLLSMLAIAAFILPHKSEATVVEFQTVLGNFEVNLYDNATPITVANFLDYVNNGAYSSSIVHRSVPDFIVQGGGFRFDLSWPATSIPANAAITNEPEFSNLRGTIAMAKTSQPDSATTQWFFNLADNSANLDIQNEGFTAFGEVVGNGMEVVDAIAALQRFNFGSPFGELPLRSNNNGNPDETNLVIVTAVIVTDTTVDSAGAAGLNPTPNTLINQPPVTPPAPSDGGGGGGAIGLLTLLLLLCTTLSAQVARRLTISPRQPSE
jgi:peptidyl-prolyl cis-trans isomerase A (cyclophilin A)